MNLAQEAGESYAQYVLRLYEGEGWRALGFKSWAALVDDKLSIGRSHSYRLLQKAKAEREGVALPESKVREIGARDLPRVAEAVKQGATPEAAYAEVKAERAANPPAKKHARQGPRGLDGECERIARGMETLNEQFELAGDDALDYLDFDTRRTFERTVDRMTDFCATWGERLQRPANPRAADDGEAA